MPERPEKKSETVKFRVPWTLKRDFLAKARREGRPASEIFRDLMEDYVRRPAQRPSIQSLETAMSTVRKHPRPAFAAILGAAGISALLAGAIPAGAAPDLRPMFEDLDRNGDGAVSRAEFEQMSIVVQADTLVFGDDQDWAVYLGDPSIRAGEPSVPETPGAAPPADSGDGPDLFAGFDTDGDGRFSMAELEAGFAGAAQDVFDALDADGDGQLDTAESRNMDSADANADGRISRREFSSALVLRLK